MSPILPAKRIVHRYHGNPIVAPEMIPYSCRGIYNSSVVKQGGRYVMVMRCEGYNLLDFFMVATSPNGYDQWELEGDVIPMPDDPASRRYLHNHYDPRITQIGDDYYITFCAHGADARMGLLKTREFTTFEWLGFITGSGFRNTVLFPEKIDGLFTALERPNSIGSIWLTQSPDLRFWGGQREVVRAEQSRTGVWGRSKIGPCGTPIKTSEGWLIIFHGVQIICDYEYLYHTGVMLTRLDDPAEVIRIGSEPILSPEEPMELAGHAPNVVFASSHVVEDDGSVKLYYGASDRYQCVADTSVDLLLHAALER